MRLFRVEDRVFTPWKNGGGRTAEIAAFPPGAGLDAFDWRVSTALIEQAGPFSIFPGIDRTLAVLTGEGVRLCVEDRAPIDMTPSSEPVFFEGDALASAKLLGGPVLDLNVMVRRGVVSATVERIELGSRRGFTPGAARLVLALSGSTIVTSAAGEQRLTPLDAVLADPGEHLSLEPDAAPCSLYLVTIADVS